MARPETIDDLPAARRTTQIATFTPCDFVTDPELTKRYAHFIELVKLRGGEISGTTHVTVSRPSTDQELADALRGERSQWDVRQGWYERHRDGDTDLKGYEVSSAKHHAKTEGLEWIENEEES